MLTQALWFWSSPRRMKTGCIFLFVEEGWLEQMKSVLESNVIIITKLNIDTLPNCGSVPLPSELDARVTPWVLEREAATWGRKPVSVLTPPACGWTQNWPQEFYFLIIRGVLLLYFLFPKAGSLSGGTGSMWMFLLWMHVLTWFAKTLLDTVGNMCHQDMI